MTLERIRSLREAQHMTPEQVASLLHCSSKTYCQYESGYKSVPASILIHLADLYNTSADYLLELTDNPVPHKKLPRENHPGEVK